MKPLKTTVEEVLRKAIDSEVETRAYYQKLAERAATPDVRKRMLELADAELLHRAKMERKYREEVGKAPPDPETPKIDLPNDLVNIDMPRALKHALERERESESYYRFMAERVPETRSAISSWSSPTSSGSTKPICKRSTTAHERISRISFCWISRSSRSLC